MEVNTKVLYICKTNENTTPMKKKNKKKPLIEIRIRINGKKIKWQKVAKKILKWFGIW